jgi:hypothetical protein
MDQLWDVDISGGSAGRGNLTPDREAIAHHLSVVGRRQQVPTNPKSWRNAEAFHRRLALPGGLMGVLGAIVQVLRPAIGHRRHHHAVSDPVAGELVGHQHPRHVPQALGQSAEELLGGLGIPARLDQDVEYVAVLVDRAPQASAPRPHEGSARTETTATRNG